jgi:hypothetical protein
MTTCTPDLRATYDAIALIVHDSNDTLAKLALERSAEGDDTIVTHGSLGRRQRVVTGTPVRCRVANAC